MPVGLCGGCGGSPTGDRTRAWASFRCGRASPGLCLMQSAQTPRLVAMRRDRFPQTRHSFIPEMGDLRRGLVNALTYLLDTRIGERWLWGRVKGIFSLRIQAPLNTLSSTVTSTRLAFLAKRTRGISQKKIRRQKGGRRGRGPFSPPFPLEHGFLGVHLVRRNACKGL